jgi:hypothetical protein
VTAAGEQAESYRYTANGVPIGIPLGDVNGDGKVENGSGDEDWQQAYWWENNFGAYDARLDLNLDGSVNATDIGLVGSQTPGTMPTARASTASVGNRMFVSAMVAREAVLGREGDTRSLRSDFGMGPLCLLIAQQAPVAPVDDWEEHCAMLRGICNMRAKLDFDACKIGVMEKVIPCMLAAPGLCLVFGPPPSPGWFTCVALAEGGCLTGQILGLKKCRKEIESKYLGCYAEYLVCLRRR